MSLRPVAEGYVFQSFEVLADAHILVEGDAREVVRLRANGRSVADIAHDLGYSERTVRAKAERVLDIALVPRGLNARDGWLAGAWAVLHLGCCLVSERAFLVTPLSGVLRQ